MPKTILIFFLSSFIGLLSLCSILNAEIEWITIRWTSSLCLDSCVKGLRARFSQIDGVADVYIDQAAGQAKLKWKPNKTFSYTPIHGAMAMIGLYIKDIHMKVHGTIMHDRQNVYLISSGDNTRFQLLGPVQVNTTGYSMQASATSHPLTNETKSLLLDVENKKGSVSIEGPLFQAWRAPPLYLITDQVNVQ
jgi:hypothetical protein